MLGMVLNEPLWIRTCQLIWIINYKDIRNVAEPMVSTFYNYMTCYFSEGLEAVLLCYLHIIFIIGAEPF